jgi:hypothetical protein
LSKNCTTPFGSELRCGHIEPGTAAIASSSRSTIAVRMLVSCRQKNRMYPMGPSFGWLMSGGRTGDSM